MQDAHNTPTNINDLDRESFNPDYQRLWNKREFNLTEWIWSSFGINPEAGEKVIELASKPDRSDKEELYLMYFDSSSLEISNILPKHTIRDYLYLKQYCSARNEAEFIDYIYQHRFPMHDDFKQKLIDNDEMPNIPTLEALKNHEQYSGDLRKSHNSISDENQALPLLFGLNPEWFWKHRTVQTSYTGKNQENGFSDYNNLKPEDKWLLHEYKAFLQDKFGSGYTAYELMHKTIEKAKNLTKWRGGLSQYVNDLYNEGFIFRDEIEAALKDIGINLIYDPNRWAVKFYKEAIERKVFWSLEEASRYCLGMNPEQGREFENFMNEYKINRAGVAIAPCSPSTIIRYDENGQYVDPPMEAAIAKNKRERGENIDIEDREYGLEGYVRSHIYKGNISPYNKNQTDKLYFEPKEFVEFVQKHLPLTPIPKALLIALGIESDKLNKTFAGYKKSEHEAAYNQYHKEKLSEFMAKKSERPWASWEIESALIKEAMTSKGHIFHTETFKEVRRNILKDYPHFNTRGKASQKQLNDIYQHLQDKKNIAA